MATEFVEPYNSLQAQGKSHACNATWKDYVLLYAFGRTIRAAASKRNELISRDGTLHSHAGQKHACNAAGVPKKPVSTMRSYARRAALLADTDTMFMICKFIMGYCVLENGMLISSSA